MLHVNSKKLQKEYLLTRILARTLLARYTGGMVDPCSLKFVRSKFGKPQVIWPTQAYNGETWHPPQLSFNLSHTQSLIACAITSGSQVGVDVEERGRALNTDVLAFARRKFSEVEAVRLEQFTDLEERRHHFLQIWTLKEAYLKALGKGIRGSTLKDIAFHFEATSAVYDLLEKATGIPAHEQAFSIRLEILNSLQLYSDTWQFLLLQPTDVHYMSICVERDVSFHQGPGDIHGLRMQIMKTTPLENDEALCNSLALGLST